MTPAIQTASGRYFNFVQPRVEDVSILDIAHALSNIARFTGHARAFYSVAQHCVLVSRIVPREHALAGLLHDAAEAYVGDVAAPLKQLLPQYKEVEARVEATVLCAFDIGDVLPSCVKAADMVALATEKRDLMCDSPIEWGILNGVHAVAERIRPMSPTMAKLAFLERFIQLRGYERQTDL